MKNFLLALFAFLLCTPLIAQTQTYEVSGNTYELRKEVEGTLTLLWNTINRDYRYFVQKDGAITELLNTETGDGYQEEYKETLAALTDGNSVETDRVNLTLGSLRRFFNAYNSEVDASYVAYSFMTAPEYRLGVFGGVTNSIFTTNPNNSSNAQVGLDLELLDPVSLPRHAAVLQFKQVFASDAYDYKSTQFSINYRYKFVKAAAVDLFVNTKLVTFTSFDRGVLVDETIQDDAPIIAASSGSSLQAPIIFGLGADIRLGKGFLTLQYHDALAVFVNSNDEFPVDVSAGYKFVF